MARPPLSADLLPKVSAMLLARPEGLSVDALLHAVGRIGVSQRTLQRRLNEWTKSGAVIARGVGKARRYLAPVDAEAAVGIESAPLVPEKTGTEETSPKTNLSPMPISRAAYQVRGYVRQPIVSRTPVSYRAEFLEAYQPNATEYLSATLVRHLQELGRTPRDEQPAGTYARDIFNRLLIDLSWASSHLEGNTYSLLDTERLIQDGRSAAGKDAKETQMILNHKAAIELLVESAGEIGINRFTILNLHALLADNLLDDPRLAGRLRATPVGIAGSTYLPTAVPQVIESMFAKLLEKAASIRDAFEQSFFLMVHIPYLQPFVDVNKRVSRLAANIPLIRGNLVPLSFIDVPLADYIDGLVGVYELNRVELLRDVFVWAYERSCRRYKTVRDSLPEPDPFRLAYRQVLIDVVGELIRKRLKATSRAIGELANGAVPRKDMKRFIALVQQEIEDLHEGNIARFRLRPSQFQAWRRTRRSRA